MSVETWVRMLVGAAALFGVFAIALALRASKAQARRAVALQQRIDSAKMQLEELRSRHDSEALSTEAFEAEEERLTRGLLDRVAELPPAPPGGLRFGSRQKALVALAALAVVCAAGLTFWRTPVAPSLMSDRALPGKAMVPAPATSGGQRTLSDAQLERMVSEASAQLRQTPDDAHVWAMLAHSYDMLGRFAESSKAYSALVRLVPGDAQALADYADALAVANGRTLAGEPTALVDRALKLDGSNVKALALAGTAAFERKDYRAAIEFWEHARKVSTDAAFRREIEGSIAETRAASRGEPLGEKSAVQRAAAAVPVAASGAVVSGRLSLADDLVAKVPPGATVFVYARPAKGSSMPVALLRKRVSDLPLDFTLDDSMAMVPGVNLSRAGTVVIGARVSSRGDVTPRPGDVQGWSAPVPVGTTGVKLEMSEVLK